MLSAMGSGGIVAIAVVGFAIVGLIAYLNYKKEQQRQAALASFAQQQGFTLTERDDSLIRRWGEDTRPFNQGYDKRCTNIMSGYWQDRPAVLFDYVFHTDETDTDSNGRTTRRKVAHRLAITAVQTEKRFPALSVSPEGMFGRLLGKLTNSDIQFEWEDFNRAFTVKCPDRKFASDVITPQMMELLMRDRELAWQISGPDIMTMRNGAHDPAGLETTLSALDQILDVVPEHVRQTDWPVS